MKRTMACLLLCGVFSASGPGAQEAFIKEVYGVVEVKAPGEDAWVQAVPGQRLEREALLSTGFRSGALIGIGLSNLTVRPLTRLSVEELILRGGDEEVQVYLRTGRVRAEVRPAEGARTSFAVRSPMVTASVRGTAFEFDGMNLRVEEGRVYMEGRSGGTYVSAGHRAGTDLDGRAGSVAESAREDLMPPLPAGLDHAVTESPGVEPSAGNIQAGFEWRP